MSLGSPVVAVRRKNNNMGKILCLFRTSTLVLAGHRTRRRGPGVNSCLEDWFRLRQRLPRLKQAAFLGEKLVEDANRQVGLPPRALVSQQVVHADVFHTQLETISLSELLSTAEVCGELGITRQRLHQLRQSDRFPEPEPDRELTATPLWMRSTLKGFTVDWRRVPGPAPRPMDGLLASGLDALVKVTGADHSNRISPLVSRSGRYPVIQAMTDSVV